MNKLNIFHQTYFSWRYPDCWLRNVRIFFRSWKWAYQRVVRGYSDYDLWSLDYYYSNLLSASLKDFAETTCSYPMGFSAEGWRAAVEAMSNCFANAYTDSWAEEETTKAVAAKEEGFELLNKYFYDLWS